MKSWLGRGLLAVLLSAAVVATQSPGALADTPEADTWAAPVSVASGGVERSLISESGEVVGTVGWRPSGEVQPMNASGCTVWGGLMTCIGIVGSGLHVATWNTTAYGNWGCSAPHYQAAGNDIHLMPIICPNSPSWGTYYANWAANQNFFDGTELCNQWSGTYARPCEYIEK